MRPALQRAVELEDDDLPVPLAFVPSVQMALLRAWTGALDPARKTLAAAGRRCIALGQEGEFVFVAFSLRARRYLAGRLSQSRDCR